MEQVGKVWLVGAGPGEVGLLTLKGKAVLERAEVVIYDALVSTEVLCLIPDEAEAINVGKRAKHHLMQQVDINHLLLEKAQLGKRVVRLKGGDPFVFGRGGEELELLAANHIPFEVVPGITSSVAVPAYAGIPLTHRDYASSFYVVTGHLQKDKALKIDFKALVNLQATLVFLMGQSVLKEICQGLLAAGMEKKVPAAILEKGTTARQRKIVATVSTLYEAAKKAAIGTPAIIVVGKVCELSTTFAWAEKRPLAGKRIVLTRPKAISSKMAAKLRECGAQVLEMPTIKTSCMEDKTLIKATLEQIRRSRGWIWLVFTSPQGVKHFFECLKALNWDLRWLLTQPQLRFAVLGSGTRQALSEYGIYADLMPETYSALELGKLLADKVEVNSKLFIFRAQEGSMELVKALQEAHLDYEDIPIYKTASHLCAAVREKIKAEFEAGAVDYVTFTSASTVTGFVETMHGIDFGKVQAICIGEQTASKARSYGMRTYISKEATMDSMLTCLQQLAFTTYRDQD